MFAQTVDVSPHCLVLGVGFELRFFIVIVVVVAPLPPLPLSPIIVARCQSSSKNSPFPFLSTSSISYII